MDANRIINRKIELKKQAVEVIQGEISELKDKLELLRLKVRFESKMKTTFDPVLSCKIDCITYLLEN